MQSVIQVRDLVKSYQDKQVVRGISFDVYKGEILCVLGPNGAGKSTTINVLTGALAFDAGTILNYGQPVKEQMKQFKQRLGVVPQDIALYEDLTAMQNIRFFAALYGLKGQELKDKCNEALGFVGLLERAYDKVETFSGGMKRRLNIACAIAHRPDLVIMDEPTVGIDPQSRNHILDSIKTLRDEGMTVIYTTHYMEEVEEIASRIIVMDNGQIIAEGSKEELKASIGDECHFVIEFEAAHTVDMSELYAITGVKQIAQDASTLTITTLKSIENLDQIITRLLTQEVKIHTISSQVASLETVFLQLTGKSLRD